MRWDIFCQVIDNYGDAGVCWRLARALASIDDSRIRLFCDDFSTLDALTPSGAITTGAPLNIEVLPWSAAKQIDACGEVVIEAFGCHLPEKYRERIGSVSPQPIWINLEYLTAEAFADDLHLMASPQNDGTHKTFYFPGFSDRTGGVILGDWDRVTAQQVPESLAVYWQQRQTDSLSISIFQYPSTSLDNWLMNLSHSLVQQQLVADLFVTPQQNITCLSLPNIQWIHLPFLPQPDYDWLLAHCDLNLVRGEDSFVRAQWAGKPFIWDIYPQSEEAHVIKHTAFCDLYFSNNASIAPAGRALMTRRPAQDWLDQLPALTQHARSWSDRLRTLGVLEVKMMDFVKSQEKLR